MDWEDLRHFLAVARTGTVSGAGRALSSSASTVIKRIRDLETTLGAPLFDRSREGYALTPFGQSVLDQAETAEDAVLGIARLAGGNPAAASASVRITTTEILGSRWIAPRLPKLFARHPNLSVELVTSPDILSLARREADISLRLVRPERGQLVARRVALMAYGIYCHRSIEGSARWISFDEALSDLTISKAIALRMGDDMPALRTTGMEVQLQAVLAGVGKALMPCFIGDAEPSLIRLPDDAPPFELELWAVVHSDLRSAPRVRAAVDFLAEIGTADRAALAGG